MNLKMMIADIDGTLVNTAREMMPLTRTGLNALHAQGIAFGIASGRPLGPHMDDVCRQWKLDFSCDCMIGMNGGQLKDCRTGRQQEFYKLSRESIREIITLMAPFTANPFVYVGEDMACQKLDRLMVASLQRHHIKAWEVKDLSELWAASTNKVLFRFTDAPEQTWDALQYVNAHPSKHYAAFRTQRDLIEFQDPRVNKGVALEQYCKDSGMPLADVMAFGDMDNDNEMLVCAGRGVCLKNGATRTRQLADAVTEYTNDEDGFGHYLYDHVMPELAAAQQKK